MSSLLFNYIQEGDPYGLLDFEEPAAGAVAALHEKNKVSSNHISHNKTKKVIKPSSSIKIKKEHKDKKGGKFSLYEDKCPPIFEQFLYEKKYAMSKNIGLSHLREYGDYIIQLGYLKSAHTMVSAAKQYAVLFLDSQVDQKQYNIFFGKLKKQQKIENLVPEAATPAVTGHFKKLKTEDDFKIGKLLACAGARLKSVESEDLVYDSGKSFLNVVIPASASKMRTAFSIRIKGNKNELKCWEKFLGLSNELKADRTEDITELMGITRHSFRRSLAIICKHSIEDIKAKKLKDNAVKAICSHFNWSAVSTFERYSKDYKSFPISLFPSWLQEVGRQIVGR